MAEQLEKTVYYKIIEPQENYNGYQFATGLNVRRCGIAFTGIDNIIYFLNSGVEVRTVKLDTTILNPEFIIDKRGSVWVANMVYLSEAMSLSEPSTYEFLKERGLNIANHQTRIFNHALSNGFLKIIKYLQEENLYVVNLKAILAISLKKGYLDIYSHYDDNSIGGSELANGVIKYAHLHQNLDMIKEFVSRGIIIFEKGSEVSKLAISSAIDTGNIDLEKYYESLGLKPQKVEV